MAATELKSVEFVFYSKGIIEIFDVHTDFTAGRMLHLYRSITQVRAPQAMRNFELGLPFTLVSGLFSGPRLRRAVVS